MKKITTATRLLLGTLFLLSGLNGLLGIVPLPLPAEGPAGVFMQTLAAAGYFCPLLRAVELTGAVLLLSGTLVPLGLVLLAPLVVNIFAFHVALAPQGLPVAVVLLAAEGFLVWRHRGHFRSMVVAPTLVAGGAR